MPGSGVELPDLEGSTGQVGVIEPQGHNVSSHWLQSISPISADDRFGGGSMPRRISSPGHNVHLAGARCLPFR